jgi:hypothetical protein
MPEGPVCSADEERPEQEMALLDAEMKDNKLILLVQPQLN